ncbi:MAG: winged helix-turn-helix domain-containing protein [DPANN group archaeon]|nr:winged helix-turn-helix domain-containing protein [DPANN group archaeon]
MTLRSDGLSKDAHKTPLDIIKKTEEQEQKLQQTITAQDLLEKSRKEIEAQLGKRETNSQMKKMKIITAILLGKKRNKDLAQVLDTDKSFATKQIKEMERQGLVTREGVGKDVTYEVDQFNVMKFLQGKVVIKTGVKKEKPLEKNNQEDGENDG